MFFNSQGDRTRSELRTASQVILAAIKGAKGHSRLSAYTIRKALLAVYTQKRLFPSGIYAEVPAVQEWALKVAVAIKKLVPRWHLMKFRKSHGGSEVQDL